MAHQRTFNVRRTDAMARDVHYIVEATQYRDISRLIDGCHVARCVVRGDHAPVVAVAFGVVPDGAEHLRPRTLNH